MYETIECALESDFRCGFRPILIRTPGYFSRRVADVPVQDATAGETADATNPGAISWPRTPAAPTPRYIPARGPALATRVGGSYSDSVDMRGFWKFFGQTAYNTKL